jgi:hypothetical protein
MPAAQLPSSARILSAAEAVSGRCRKCRVALALKVGDQSYSVGSAKAARTLRNGLMVTWWTVGGLALVLKAVFGIPWAFVIVGVTLGVVGLAVDYLCFRGQGLVTGAAQGGTLVCPSCGAWKTQTEL